MPKYLLTNEIIAAERWKMLETNPAYSEDLTSLQKAGKSAVCTYFRVLPGVTNVTSGDFPTDLALTKSAWRSDILNGNFAAGTWTFRVRFESTTKYGFSIKVACRLSKSANADGSSATLIGTYESPNTIAIPVSAGGSVSDSWTASLGALTLTNEYLFAEYRIHIEVAGSNANAECAFACDEDPAVADESIETTAFTPSAQTFYQSLPATAVGVSLLIKASSFYRTLGTTAVALPAMSKEMYLTLPATAIGMAYLVTAKMFSKVLEVVAQGIANLVKVTIYSKVLAAMSVGIASLARIVTYKQALIVVATGLISLTKTTTHYVGLAASAIGIPQLLKGITKTLSVVAMGISALKSVIIIKRTLGATAQGIAGLMAEFIAGAGATIRGWWTK